MSIVKPADQLRGLRIAAFESRRAKEIAEMIRRYGGDAVGAPAMRELPLDEQGPAMDFALRLLRGSIDVALFLTGVGTRLLVESVSWKVPREDLAHALRAITTVARGPKPTAVLREMGVTPTVLVPEPNTWRELLAALDEHVLLRGKRVAVQEYGEENPDLLAGLAQRGSEILRVPIYRWGLPEDTRPLHEAIHEILEGRISIALFTSAAQVRHLLQVAGAALSEPLRKALDRAVVASIGPVCSEAIRSCGLNVDVEPDHPKMGFLISAVAEHAPVILKAKRRD